MFAIQLNYMFEMILSIKIKHYGIINQNNYVIRIFLMVVFIQFKITIFELSPFFLELTRLNILFVLILKMKYYDNENEDVLL